MKNSKTTVVLGASPKSDRISNQAVAELVEYGYTVIPVHPVAGTIQDLPVKTSLAEIDGPVDTLTVYMNAQRSSGLEQEILALHPRRVIFNPGAENSELESVLLARGIDVENACTLILLRTEQF